MADENDAKQVFVTYGGLNNDDADALVRAAVDAARAEMLDYVAGAAPVPSPPSSRPAGSPGDTP